MTPFIQVRKKHFPVQILIFLNRYAPRMVITSVKPPITAPQTSGLICETPVRPYRIPSTPYVRGSSRVKGTIHAGKELMGKRAPDRPNIGKTTKFMMSWKPVISSMRDAIAIPNAVNDMPIRIMNARAIRNPTGSESGNPTSTDRTRIMDPWMHCGGCSAEGLT